MLRQLPRVDDANLLVGDNPADDAAVYRVTEDLALVQSVDFFTPVVDDPATFGRIAVANSLSDIYAMGGTPLIALNVVGFPVKDLPIDMLSEVLRGGTEKAQEAGLRIIGGHTVDDPEPKYGLAVTGTIDPRNLITARNAHVGDVLLLTKPLGTGTISTALKAGTADDADVAQAVRWMEILNRDAAVAMRAAGVNAATDVTGFGLLGHLVDMCRASGVSASIRFPAIPLLPFAFDYAERGYVPAGTSNNLQYVEGAVDFHPDLSDAALRLLADPQTSGGLLVSLDESRCSAFVEAASEQMLVAEIGRVEGGSPGNVRVLQQ